MKTTENNKSQRKYIAGIDIGTTKIVVMIGSKNQYGKLEILGYGNIESGGIKRGMVGNMGKTINSIISAVSIAQAKAGITISEAYVGIAGEHIKSMEISDYITRMDPDKMIDGEDLDKLCQCVMSGKTLYPGEQIIHILPQEYKVDNQADIYDPIGMVGSRLEGTFHVITGQKGPIKNIQSCVDGANIDLKGLTLEPIASSASVLSEDEKNMGVALVDIGGGTTDLAIFKDGSIRYTAVIPLAGNVIDTDIQQGCEVTIKQAKQLKEKYGAAFPENTSDNEVISVQILKGQPPKEIRVTTLAEIIRCRMEEIFGLILNGLDNYGYQEPRKKLIGGIVLTGGGSELKNIVPLIQYLTGLPTRIGRPDEHLASNTPDELSSPMYATAIGLLLYGIAQERNGEQRVDFSHLCTVPSSIQEPTNEKEAPTEIPDDPPIEAKPIVLPVAEEPLPKKEKEKEKEKEEQKPEKKNFIKVFSDKVTDFFKTME